MLLGALMRRSMESLTVYQSVEQAAVPGLPGIQGDMEVEPTIGKSRLGPTLRRSHHHRANEIAVVITGPQLLPRLRPRRDDMPTAHDIVRLYFEYVSEVATRCNLKLKVNPADVIVGNVEVLVHSLANQPADNKTKRAWRNDPVRCPNRSIR
jgi:hypothetical protein